MTAAIIIFLSFAAMSGWIVAILGCRPKRKMTVKIEDILDGEYPMSIFLPGPVAVYSLHQKDRREIPYCWAMISGNGEDYSEAVLWMIYTREKYRKSGYAKALIRELQKKYKKIITQYELGIVNSPGVKLCVSCGFQFKQSIFNKKPSQLIWEKGR